ncbi:MAG: glycoside hydrolase family 127 protein [Treponema sp.]|nr:glycoside hydrolase family 127 protein [Treponema sp.]
MKKILTFAAMLAAGETIMNAQKTELTAGTLFATSQQTGLEYVLDYNPDRMLAPAASALGKKTKAKAYGGWESRPIQGHMLGHYLSALAGFYAQTGSTEAKEKLDYTVSRIQDMQRPDGYFGGIPSQPFDTVAAGGDFPVERFSLASWWVPWYSVHKIYAGLIDAYVYGKNEAALSIVTRMADWAISRTGGLNDSEMQKMLTCEHGGMCKVFADLYGITGDERYLSEAERWIHREIIEPAMQQKDTLQGYHANTQISKFIGLARLYELTGKSEYRTAAEFFFSTVTERRSYAIGGNSRGEHFGREYDEPLSRDTCETCNTYNMLELAEHIFRWNAGTAAGRATADFYEKALYNHILASQDPETGAKTYFVAMQPGFFKVYCTHDNAMWCCTGTGLENPARYNRFIAVDQDDTLYINLFIDSTVTTEDGWVIRIKTAFPYETQATVTVLQEGTRHHKLKVRAPVWSGPLSAEAGPDGYADFGNLALGKTVTLQLEMQLAVRRAPDESGNFSITCGPLVLAADLGNKDLPVDIVDDHLVYMNSEKGVTVPPVLLDEQHPERWISEVAGEPLTFRTAESATASGTSYTLRPFFSVHHRYYAVYFTKGSEKTGTALAAAGKITVDVVEPGRQQSEIEHGYKTELTRMGYLKKADASYREFQEKDAYIQYQLVWEAGKENQLLLTVCAQDGDSLSVSVDGSVLKTFALTGTKPCKPVTVCVPLPAAPAKAHAANKAGQEKERSTATVTVTGSRGVKLLEVRTVR